MGDERSCSATVEQVQNGLGHSDSKTTEGYIQESDDALRQRLIAEHQPLPLAGGSAVDGLIKQVREVYSRLSREDKIKLAKGIRDLLI